MAVARRQRAQRQQPGQELPAPAEEPSAELPEPEAPETETVELVTPSAEPEAPPAAEPEAELPVPAEPVAGPQSSLELNADHTEKALVDTLKSFRDKQGREDAAAWIARGLLERDLFRAYRPSGPPPRHAAPVTLVESVRRREPEWMLPDRRERPPLPV